MIEADSISKSEESTGVVDTAICKMEKVFRTAVVQVAAMIHIAFENVHEEDVKTYIKHGYHDMPQSIYQSTKQISNNLE